jgi:uncharacterized membrane protein
MAILILGLVIFLGAHSLRIFADGFRSAAVARLGLPRWKMVFSLISLLGLLLIIWGFGLARQQPTLLYIPPVGLRHLNSLITLVAFVLITAAYVPRNHLKAMIGHPMLAGVALWAFGHLLATGMLHDAVLFGAFLLWAVVDFFRARRRDRSAATRYAAGTLTGSLTTVAIGVVTWGVFAFWLHGWLIGVRPFA